MPDFSFTTDSGESFAIIDIDGEVAVIHTNTEE
jgi:hypothetical protein